MDATLLLKAIILGIVEGLTEFLPISSTGHLIIVGDLLGYVDEQSKVFKIVIQLGAILAVCWLYRERIVALLRGLPHDPGQRRFAGLILLAFMPAAVLGVSFHGVIKAYLFNPLSVALALIVGGIVILYLESRDRAPRYETVDSLSWDAALKVGLAQAAAMFPGVSRSGATIMGGLFFGLSRKAAAEFSFFLAIPTMFAAAFYDLYKNWAQLDAADLPVFVVGFLAAFVSAMLTVRALLAYIAHHTFVVFAWYRIVFGGVVLVTAYTGQIEWSVPG